MSSASIIVNIFTCLKNGLKNQTRLAGSIGNQITIRSGYY